MNLNLQNPSWTYHQQDQTGPTMRYSDTELQNSEI